MSNKTHNRRMLQHYINRGRKRLVAQFSEYYIEMERTSRSGVVYKYYKKIVDISPAVKELLNKNKQEDVTEGRS